MSWTVRWGLNSAVQRPLFQAQRLPRQQRWNSSHASSPLRILFCGSDEFSAASLKAIHQESAQNPSLIESIDVVVRPPKPTGRGYKTIRQVPLQAVAEELSLPLHLRDTFTGWTPPVQPNLIIAVSFGLFVPPRILRAAEYGGLNIHPSLLPDLRGPAPLQWALLLDRQHTGVTLQTLSEHDFDRGEILAQTEKISIPSRSSVAGLRDLLAPISAQMLVESLRKGLHVPPYVSAAKPPSDGLEMVEAKKLTPLHRELFRPLGLEKEWVGVRTARRIEILGGRAWSHALKPGGERTRLTFQGVETVPRVEWPVGLTRYMDAVEAGVSPSATAGELAEDTRVVVWDTPPSDASSDPAGARVVTPYYQDPNPENEGSVIVPVDTRRGDVVRIRSIIVEGKRARPADAVLRDYSRSWEQVQKDINQS